MKESREKEIYGKKGRNERKNERKGKNEGSKREGMKKKPEKGWQRNN